MNTLFRFIALPPAQFAALFRQSVTQLQVVDACRATVDERPEVPCRVSLVDAAVGETVLLLHFTHHDEASPYRESGPIFVRRDATTVIPAVDEIPAMFRHRLVSLRGYDASAMMVGADVVNGSELEDAIRRLFANEGVSYLHVHNAGTGCYLCRGVRA